MESTRVFIAVMPQSPLVDCRIADIVTFETPTLWVSRRAVQMVHLCSGCSSQLVESAIRTLA